MTSHDMKPPRKLIITLFARSLLRGHCTYAVMQPSPCTRHEAEIEYPGRWHHFIALYKHLLGSAQRPVVRVRRQSVTVLYLFCDTQCPLHRPRGLRLDGQVHGTPTTPHCTSPAMEQGQPHIKLFAHLRHQVQTDFVPTFNS